MKRNGYEIPENKYNNEIIDLDTGSVNSTYLLLIFWI